MESLKSIVFLYHFMKHVQDLTKIFTWVPISDNLTVKLFQDSINATLPFPEARMAIQEYLCVYICVLIICLTLDKMGEVFRLDKP